MDVTALNAQYDAEYKNNADNRRRLRNKLYNNSSTWDDMFTRIPTESTLEEWAYSDHDEILQPWQSDWTPKGELTAYPNPIGLFRGKWDLEDIPDKYVKTWLGQFTNPQDGRNPKNYPLIRYWIEDHIIPRVHQDRYLAWGFLGEYAAPTPGTPGPASTTGNGLRKIIRDHVTGGAITPWVGGVFPTTASGMVTYIESFVKGLPEEHRMRPMQLGIRQSNWDLYDEGFREKYNLYYNAEASASVRNYPNITLIPLGNMGTSDLIFCASKQNMLLFQKGNVKKTLLQVESLKRQVFIFSDMHEGYGFDNPTQVFTNDQDLS